MNRKQSQDTQAIQAQLAIKASVVTSSATGAAMYDYWLAQEKLDDKDTPKTEYAILVRESNANLRKIKALKQTKPAKRSLERP